MSYFALQFAHWHHDDVERHAARLRRLTVPWLRELARQDMEEAEQRREMEWGLFLESCTV